MPFCHKHEEDPDEDEPDEEAAMAEERKLRLGAVRHKQRLGESLVGNRRESSPYDVSFLDSVDWRVLCKKTLSTDELAQLKEAIHNNYFFEMFVEDLPMWGYVGEPLDEDFIIGEVSGSKTFFFPHLHFYLGYNKDQIVAAKVTTDVCSHFCVVV